MGKTAFSDGMYHEIMRTVHTMAARMGRLITCPVPARDILMTMIKDEEELAFMQRAHAAGMRDGQYATYFTFPLNDLLHIQLDAAWIGGVTLPSHFTRRQPNLSPDQTAALTDYAERKRALSDHWTNLSILLQHLQSHCTSPQQVRYVLPCLIGIMSNSDSPHVRKLASKLTPTPIIRNRPTIYPEMRPIIEASNRLVSQAILLKDATLPDDNHVPIVRVQGRVICSWSDDVSVPRVQV